MKIYAHRGASKAAPENTMEAFRLALEYYHVDGIELDVQLSSDGELVVIHDETLQRTTDGSGYVASHTFAELKQLSAGIRFSKRFADAKIPALAEVLELCRAHDCEVNIELKNSKIDYPNLEERVLSLVSDMGLNDRVMYSSFNHLSMAALKRLDPNALCALLYGKRLVNAADYVQAFRADGLNINHHRMNRALANELHEAGLLANCYTPDSTADIRRLVRAEVDILITNRPSRALRVISEEFCR